MKLDTNNLLEIEASIINLNKYPSRYANSFIQLKTGGFKNITRHAATDVKESNIREILYKKSGNDNFLKTKATDNELSCAFAHISILENFLNNEKPFHLIFEDDIILHSNFTKEIDTLSLDADDFDILYLGGWYWSSGDDKRWIFDKSEAESIGGLKNIIYGAQVLQTHAMLVNKNFAKIAVEIFYDKKNFIHPIDHFFNSLIKRDIVKSIMLCHDAKSSTNYKKFQVRDKNMCGLVYQSGELDSTIQTIEKNFGEIDIDKSNSNIDWLEYEPEDIFTYEKSELSDNLHLEKQNYIPSNGLLHLSLGFAGNDGMVFNFQKFAINETSWIGNRLNRDQRQTLFFLQNYAKFSKAKEIKKLNGKCLYIKSLFDSVYGHILLDELPKLEIIKNKLPIKIEDFEYIVLPHKNFRHFNVFKKYLGYKDNQLLEIPNESLYQFDSLYVPTFRGSGRVFRKGSFNFLRPIFNLEDNIKPFRKIYISRSEAQRNMNNEKELCEFLSSEGFEIIIPHKTENLPQIFNEAKIVMGVHGSNLADCCFCQKGSTLIELLPSFHIYAYYASLAKAVGMDYHSLIFEVKRDTPFLADIEKIKLFLNKI
ncbi:MAG: hypothetical protein RLZZ414_756 [Bacteroidota bacterium]